MQALDLLIADAGMTNLELEHRLNGLELPPASFTHSWRQCVHQLMRMEVSDADDGNH
jgi:hypothetical protein